MQNTDTENLPGPAIGCISSMVERRDEALAKISQAMELIDEAQKIAPEYSFESALRQKTNWHLGSVHNIKQLTKSLDKQCWNDLLDQTKFGAVMTAEQFEEVRKEIATTAPELTLNRAMTTFMGMYSQRDETFKRGIVDVFCRLSGRFKSHDAFKVQNRLIMTNAISGVSWGGLCREEQFNDLWKYLAILDDEDPTTVEFQDRPSQLICNAVRRGETEISFKQFDVRIFENGNLHIWLKKRPDLIRKVNNLIAKHYGETLPA